MKNEGVPFQQCQNYVSALSKGISICFLIKISSQLMDVWVLEEKAAEQAWKIPPCPHLHDAA